MVSMFPSKPS